MAKVPEPGDKFTVVTSQLLTLVGIAIDLQEHDAENREYWNGFRDGICILLGDLAGKRPVIVREEHYYKVMDRLMEDEVESTFDGDEL